MKKIIRNIQVVLLFLMVEITAYSQDKNICNDLLNMNVADSILIEKFDKVGIKPFYHNKIKLITNGKDKFDDLFEEIRKAKHHIHLEYFNFRNDSISNKLFEILAEKAKEGVQIRALFDAFGNMSNSKPLTNDRVIQLNRLGINIVKFDPIEFPYLNHAFHRDHRKIVVIDGKVGYTGGMNIANYYIHGTKKIGDWRDTHLRIEGNAVNFLQEIFVDMWNKETKEGIDLEKYTYYDDTNIFDSEYNRIVAVADRVPRKTNSIIRDGYEIAINSANDNISIVNPYFVPTNKIYDSLKRALKRGVELNIMISSASDISFTPDAALYKLNKLRKKGANVFLYEGGFHHSKIMMVDDKYSTVGTANLNSRSLRYDYETNIFIFDKDITSELSSIFLKDREKCIILDKDYWNRRGCWKRFVSWFANIFTPFL